MTGSLKYMLLAGAALALPASAAAQSAQQDTAAEEADQNASTGGVRQIVVTARRTSENLQSVPLAVTALDPMALEQRQVVEVADIGRVSPGLSVQSGGTGNASLIYLAIRGNAQNSPNSFSDPAVGIYVDGVYLARPIASNNGLLDLASVEVLRGTQGTLFGRNTTGGALNMTTVAPSGILEGYVEGSVGTYQTFFVEGAVNVPLTSEVSARVAARYGERNEGFGRNPLRERDAAAIDHDLSLRGTIAWSPDSVPLDVSVSADYIDIVDTYNNVALVGVNPTGPAVALYSNQFTLTDFLQTEEDFYDTFTDPNTGNPNIDDQTNYNQAFGVRATIELDLGAVSIKSISAYRESDTGDSLDLDGTPAPIGAYSSDYVQEQISEELQFSGNGIDGRLQWIFGGFYFKEEGREQSASRVFAATDFGIDFAPANTNRASFESESKALFAQANFDLTDQFTVTGGFRYTWDSRSINRRGFIGGQPGFDDVFLSNGTPVVLPPEGLCQVGPNANMAPPGPDCQDPVSAEFDYPAWLISADYQITPDTLVYARFGGAALAGGLNARPTPPGFNAFSPEKVKDVEVGFKGDFLNDRLRTNLAAFYLWRDGAQNIVNALVGVNLTQFVQNAGDVRSYGVEFESTLIPWEGMEIVGAVAYLDSRYADGSFIADGLGGPVDRSDEIVPRSPEWTWNIGATQTFRAGEAEIALHADYAYTSSIVQDFATADLTAPALNDGVNDAAERAAAIDFIDTQNSFSRIPSYGVMNVRASATFDFGLELAIWGRNVTDEKYYTALFNGYGTFGTAIRFQAAPRTFGATAAYRF